MTFPAMNPPKFGTPAPAGMPPLPPALHATNPGAHPAPAPAHTPNAPGAHAAAPANALSPQATALNTFANSAGMKFAEQQGANVLNNMYAAHGQVQSGAAAKALQTFGQNTALQQYFPMYMSELGQQQAMGAQAASAIGGVGSSYGNTVAQMGQNTANSITGINAGVAGAIGQGATNIGNANANQAAIGGIANGNMYNTIGSSLGQLGSSFFQPHPSAPTSGFNAATNPIYGAPLY